MVVFPKVRAMNLVRHFIHLGVLLLLLASGTIACVAGSSDPSGRVARLQYVAGEISVQPDGSGEWVTDVHSRTQGADS
jgi:hypothetical protein